ncbi:MAG: LAGLIDADG family homing endonuclease [Anaerolineae bacterium]
MNKLFAVTGKRQNRPTEKAIALTFHRAPVAEFLAENFGKDSASKKLPPWFLDLPDDVLSAFVKRFWTGDGSTGHEFYQLTTVSAMLAGQIRLILQRLGVAVHVYQDGERTTAWGPKTVRSRPRFLLKAFGKQRRALAKILGMKVNSEQEGIHLVQLEKEGLWVPVRRIEVKEYDGLVYNLSTDDHSYTTIQGCVHNCWLKRTVGDLYPDLFATPLSPKSDEMVADASKAGGMEQAKRRFEEMLTQSFREIRRVLRPDGIAVVVFAHKTTEAWETVIGALLSAGLYLTASWPVHTEMQARLRAQESAALASSIYMVCRKRPFRPDGRPSVGEYAAVQREMEARIREKLAQFWEEGIRGADFFMSAIGPAVEAFGRYDRVERLSGDPVTVAELLDDVRRMVGEFALERILTLTPPPPPAAAPPPLSRQAGEGRGPGGEVRAVDPLTRFYLLWRWTYNHARVPFDDARKLAAIVGVELTEHWGPGGLVEKQKEYVHVRAPHERARDPRFVARMEGQSAAPSRPTMVDALHWAAVLWAENRIAELQDYLAATYGENEAFWQVVQAVGDVLPEGDRERQLLQGLLYGRQHYTRGARQLRLG